MAQIDKGSPVPLGETGEVPWSDLVVLQSSVADIEDVMWYDPERHLIGALVRRGPGGEPVTDPETGDVIVQELCAILVKRPPAESAPAAPEPAQGETDAR